jgi:SNF2 family DNA or RNA helicase
VIQPLYLGERKVFEERFCQKTKESSVILTNQGESLRALISPFAKRRVKEEVLKELPQKIETVVWAEMTDLQKKYYHQLVEEGLVKLTSLRAQKKPLLFQNSVLTLLLRLRQIACDLRLVQPELAEQYSPIELSGKWQLFFDKVEQTKNEGGKVLFFSQFVQTLQLLKSELEKQQLNFAYFDGSTRDRADQVKYFQENDDCSFFLISLKSGAYGLNLTAADQVVIIDPWWNPTVEAQAIDRAHRFGQRKVVNAMRWVSVGTIEEKIQRLQLHKLNLQKGIFDDEQNMPLKMDEDELIQWISSSTHE